MQKFKQDLNEIFLNIDLVVVQIRVFSLVLSSCEKKWQKF